MKEISSLYLVRHCETTGQEPTAPLTAVGYQQSKALSEFLSARNPIRLVCSPYLRARQSIEPLATRLALPIEEDERLVERRLGAAADGDWKKALRESFDDKVRCLPDGESTASALARGRAVINDVLGDGRLPAVVVTHGNLLSLIAHSVDVELGYDFWQGLTNPDVFAIDNSGGKLRLFRIWE